MTIGFDVNITDLDVAQCEEMIRKFAAKPRFRHDGMNGFFIAFLSMNTAFASVMIETLGDVEAKAQMSAVVETSLLAAKNFGAKYHLTEN